ncbi:MAG: polysaccharide biosynthesis/export family protein [Phycisphaeraceae bacterium]|nr:polysaccharide biosynthesis/export family protein [Phycisphaeraceae bacterium]
MGSWQRTPRVTPILRSLDVVDEPSTRPEGVSQVEPEDLRPLVREYVIGSGDLITFNVFELIAPGVESVQTRRVDELGRVRLPVLGMLQVKGSTPTEVEEEIARTLRTRGILQDPTVSVIVQDSARNVFMVNSAPITGGVNIGRFPIRGTDFTLTEAITMARGVPGSIKTIYVIRRVPLEGIEVDPDRLDDELPRDPADLLRELEGALRDRPANDAPRERARGPVAPGLDLLDTPAPPHVHMGGRWVRAAEAADQRDRPGREPSEQILTQRIIEIPYDRLSRGDLSFDIIIRPGDIIWVPPPTAGNVFIGGEIARPGTFQLPGDGDLTLKQLVIAAGGFGPTAIPRRVDLIRRLPNDQEVTVRLDAQAIFNGTEPDIYLKPEDTINVGTSFWAVPLAVFRNGFRMSYGFGFVLDRNFNTDVFGR